MSSSLTHTRQLLNVSKTQQHPFHVLGLSRLPIVMAALAGGLAISIIVKLQNVVNLSNFLFVGELIMQPFFSVMGVLPALEIPEESVDSRIMQFLVLILITL
jgi:hypothetical protein